MSFSVRTVGEATGKKEVVKKDLWPQHAIGSIIQPEGANYDEMSWQELNNGFTAIILSKCKKDTDPNRLNAYGLFAPLSSVLEFNAGYDRHLHSLKIASFNRDKKSDKKNKGSDKRDDRDDSSEKNDQGPPRKQTNKPKKVYQRMGEKPEHLLRISK